MERERTSRILLLALLASMAIGVASAADPRGGPTPVAVNGSYAVTFNVRVPASLPSGTTILCKARVAPNAPRLGSLRLASTPMSNGQASVAGSTANCQVQIPFSWTVNDPQNGVALSYEIDAVSASGALPVAVIRQEAIASYPAAGTSANLRFQLAF
jgi:hypothetical protein